MIVAFPDDTHNIFTITNYLSLGFTIMCRLSTKVGAQWLSGRVFDSRPRGRGFEPHGRHCVVSLSKNINPSLVLVQPRKTRRFMTERLLMGRTESNQTKQKSTKATSNRNMDMALYSVRS